jgi:hypothetical protein
MRVFIITDGDLQRWLNRDPIQELGGVNLYEFVGNNPMDWIDPFGTCGGAFGSRIQFPNLGMVESGGSGNGYQGYPQNDRQIYHELNDVNDKVNSELPFWPIRLANLLRGDVDTSYRNLDNIQFQYRYTGNQFPELLGYPISARDINYLGLGYGSAKADLPQQFANYIAGFTYGLKHGSDPSNAQNAFNAGYSAYINQNSPCPDSFETSENGVASSL